MTKNTIYEEIFLNASLSLQKKLIGGFVLNYFGNSISENSIFPLYEKNESNIELNVKRTELFLKEKHIMPIFRIVNEKDNVSLDKFLSKNKYRKIEESIILGCSPKEKKEELFEFADFYEMGIYNENNIQPNDEFSEDYFKLRNFNRDEIITFNKGIERNDLDKFSLSLVESNILIGQSYLLSTKILNKKVAVIKDIIIDERYRKHGYSSRLLNSILTLAIKNDIDFIICELPISNINLIHLFDKNKMFKEIYRIFYKGLIN